MANEPTKLDDGGQAFPCPEGHSKCFHPKGMSLRDWFAGQALANLYTASHIDAGKTAHHAFRLADAMLIQREYSEAAETAPRRGGLETTDGDGT